MLAAIVWDKWCTTLLKQIFTHSHENFWKHLEAFVNDVPLLMIWNAFLINLRFWPLFVLLYHHLKLQWWREFRGRIYMKFLPQLASTSKGNSMTELISCRGLYIWIAAVNTCRCFNFTSRYFYELVSCFISEHTSIFLWTHLLNYLDVWYIPASYSILKPAFQKLKMHDFIPFIPFFKQLFFSFIIWTNTV